MTAGTQASPRSAKDEWTLVHDQFTESLLHAGTTYRTVYWINIIIVSFGIVFLLSALYLAFARGLDLSSVSFAGVGVATFVTVFLANPQTRIQQSLVDLDKTLIIYRTWLNEFQAVETLLWSGGNLNPTKLEEVSKYNAELHRVSDEAVVELRKYVGPEPKSS